MRKVVEGSGRQTCAKFTRFEATVPFDHQAFDIYFLQLAQCEISELSFESDHIAEENEVFTFWFSFRYKPLPTAQGKIEDRVNDPDRLTLLVRAV